MLTLQDIRNKPSEIAERLKIRGLQGLEIINNLQLLDEKAREQRAIVEQMKSEANAIAKEVGELMKAKKITEANAAKEKTGELKNAIKNADDALNDADAALLKALYEVPNAPQADVPPGKTAEDNKTVLEWGDMPNLPTNAKPHWELAKDLDIIDFELGVKITGAGFPVYKGKGARFQRSLINFFLDQARDAGYTEIQPPLMVNEASGIGTGQLPDKEGQMYHDAKDDLYLIPTSEVPVTNIYRDVLLMESDLPIKNTAYSPCFRREAGSYGAHVRGLNRLHQFDKVEIVQITRAEESNKSLQSMQNYVQGLLQKLGLKYRVLLLCGGDMGFSSAKTYDMEVWSAAQEKWLECSSVSNFETFQTNRLRCRYKNAEGNNVLCHSLNGSALALPRIVAALLENNQTEKGIKVPEVLIPYCGFEYIN